MPGGTRAVRAAGAGRSSAGAPNLDAIGRVSLAGQRSDLAEQPTRASPTPLGVLGPMGVAQDERPDSVAGRQPRGATSQPDGKVLLPTT